VIGSGPQRSTTSRAHTQLDTTGRKLGGAPVAVNRHVHVIHVIGSR
jgi:hypothetical protein